MSPTSPPLSRKRILLVSGSVFLLVVAIALFLQFRVQPLPPSQDTERSTRSFEMVSVVLGLLTGGCMAGYFSFDYNRVHVRHKRGALFISWMFIGSVYILTFLILYALRRAGALSILDRWAMLMLFLALYGFLNGITLFEFWKMGQFWRDGDEVR